MAAPVGPDKGNRLQGRCYHRLSDAAGHRPAPKGGIARADLPASRDGAAFHELRGGPPIMHAEPSRSVDASITRL